MKAMFMLFVCSTLSVFSYDQTKKLTLAVDGIENVRMDCGAGFLVVEGSGNTIEVTAHIEIRNVSQSDEKDFIERYLELSLEKRGSEAVLISHFRNDDYFGSDIDASIDLTVSVPRNLNLEIEDGSGKLKVSGMKGNVSIDDGSGSLEVYDVGGNLTIEDGSGDIEVKNIGGNVEVSDGSGSMDIYKINGNVEVTDGSGEIDIDAVEQNVVIRSDGSGGVQIANVKGSVNRKDDEYRHRKGWKKHRRSY